MGNWFAGKMGWAPTGGRRSGMLEIDVYLSQSWIHSAGGTIVWDMATIVNDDSPIVPETATGGSLGSDVVAIRFPVPSGVEISESVFEFDWTLPGTGLGQTSFTFLAEVDPLTLAIQRRTDVAAPSTTISSAFSDPITPPFDLGTVPVSGPFYIYVQIANFSNVTITPVSGHLTISWQEL